MVNPSKMDQKIKSSKFVPAAAVEEGEQKTWGNKGKGMDGEFDEVVEEGEMETWDKEGKDKLEDLVMDDEFENSPLELTPEDYEGGWGDEFHDPEFDKKLRG
jgi:hypothetical protein